MERIREEGFALHRRVFQYSISLISGICAGRSESEGECVAAAAAAVDNRAAEGWNTLTHSKEESAADKESLRNGMLAMV